MSIPCQSSANPGPIQHQSSTNLVSIQSINMAPIWCQSNANRMSIKNQSTTNPHHLVVNSSPIRQSFDNPRPIQNLTPIRCQSMTNLPIHDQLTNSSPIWPLHAPISANRKNRTVTDRQDIGTHWHRSRQSRGRTGNRFTTVHRQLTIEDQSIRTQIATQSPLNREPIGNQSVRTNRK